MNMKRCLLIFLSVSLFLFTPAIALAETSGEIRAPIGGQPVDVNAASVVLMDAITGEILMEKNPEQVRAPASLVKLLTMKVLWEALDQGRISLNDKVRVSEDAWRTGGSKMFIRVGSEVEMLDIFKGIIIASGNDATVAAAEHVSGSVQSFVGLMNERAKELGLKNTVFVDPHGLSDDNVTTALDIAMLARAYINDHPQALEFHSTKEFTYTPPEEHPIPQQNRNRLLWAYEGADGLKTGYTELAGFNLVATAKRDGNRFIAVVLGVPGDTIPQGESRRAQEVPKVLDFGFANFHTASVVEAGEAMGEVRVWKGRANEVQVVAESDGLVTLLKGTDAETTANLDKDVQAPVAKGQKLGEIVITRQGERVGTIPVVAAHDVARGNFFKVLIDSIRLLFSGIRIGTPSS